MLIWLYAVAISILIGAALNSAARSLFPTPGGSSPGGAEAGEAMPERIGHGADLVAEQFLRRDASASPGQGHARP